MKHLSIFPYKMASVSALLLRKGLSEALGRKVVLIAHQNSAYQHNSRKIILNWGSVKDNLRNLQVSGPVINPVESVALCSNKLRFFQQIRELARVPEFTADAREAENWYQNGAVVMGRAELNSHSGRGIIFSDQDPTIFAAGYPLYVKYVPKKLEFRVHIFDGNIIDVQQKLLRKTDENGLEVDPAFINFRVRNHSNGFIFARQEVKVPEDVIQQALNAFHAVPNLNFGAFDVIFNQKQGQAYVLECNTAPGIEGSTVTSYVHAIVNHLKGN